MTLKYNPFAIFRDSRTPAGLYARQKWLGESADRKWQDDFQITVFSLMKGQCGDGSWHHSPLETIRRLFGLHLTVRDLNEDIDRALTWLMAETLHEEALIQAGAPPISSSHLHGLPFTPGQPRIFLFSATLFLSSVFHRTAEALVTRNYEFLAQWVAANEDNTELWSDKSNALRAFIVDPSFAEHSATVSLIYHLGRMQDPSGCWPAPIPFFQTVNALAHSDLPSACDHLAKALQRLPDFQNVDGSWGQTDQEWNTFLMVHALKNKAYL